jgi:SAM-dependent methyltransferase
LDKHLEAWNKTYSSLRNEEIRTDDWLDRYAKALASAGARPILDLGCGSGNDTKYLIDRGYSVVACDYSEEAIENIKTKLPKARALAFDMREGLPFSDGEFQAVISDLSIHYFPWDTTAMIVRELHRVLGEGGQLLLRVNSTKDFNHGAGRGEPIEENFYLIDGIYKRFFDGRQLDELFGAGWKILVKKKARMERYEKTKELWELLVERA